MSSSRSKRATGGADDSGPLNQYLPKENPHGGEDVDLGFTRFTRQDERTPDLSSSSSGSSAPKERRRLTEEEAHKVQKLMGSGTSAKAARAAVLGEEA